MKRPLCVVAFATVFFTFAFPRLAFAMEPRTGANLKGIDVSHWDGVIQWKLVAQSHVRFAYIKATGGKSFLDPQFTANVRNARANGIVVGAYHYAHPTAPFNPREPVEEATWFVKTMRGTMSDFGDLMPVLDIESSGSLSTRDLVQWIRIFVETVQKQTHRRVMLYTSEDFIQQHGDFADQLSDIPLWIAYYDRLNHGKIPPDIGGWRHWTVWQYSDRGVVNGIPHPVDLDAGVPSLNAMKGDLPAAQGGAANPASPPASTSASPAAVTGKPKTPVPTPYPVPSNALWRRTIIGSLMALGTAAILACAVVLIKKARRTTKFRSAAKSASAATIPEPSSSHPADAISRSRQVDHGDSSFASVSK